MKTIYPPRCLSCGDDVVTGGGLCTECWSQAHFISGPVCGACGTPVSDDGSGDQHVRCEACHKHPPPWHRGRAVALYEGPARRMVLSLKHGDRLDLVPDMAAWMARASADLCSDGLVVAPVPLHWSRLMRRRYNQSALLAAQTARAHGARAIPDLLKRIRATKPQQDMDRTTRFDNQRAAITASPAKAALIENRNILLVDDVMTTGATLSACAEVCLSAGARQVDIVVFARVAWPE